MPRKLPPGENIPDNRPYAENPEDRGNMPLEAPSVHENDSDESKPRGYDSKISGDLNRGGTEIEI
ncbi:MAG: hypothetical protein COX80_04665 [Candidatus Magasanikbacteria bacterium CG_4_10_14_0_2_um_filter_33_14]|uniref:Uncharacterized protein n=1 Tax=Candidatus Magasanikbacteria bacterium CG_4_10_14_0_2_um_filter_33_14 TaxID=1974636 RepID=A0A2M7V957_9BACT|nr:MAG: hypothetical protein COX80_04665 [Candidatus Magasanikbacteria bacterium CG_4_10_14_0_2_um_filter_33_14]